MEQAVTGPWKELDAGTSWLQLDSMPALSQHLAWNLLEQDNATDSHGKQVNNPHRPFGAVLTVGGYRAFICS